MVMIAKVYRCEGDAASNGGGDQYWMCVDRKVHLEHMTSWYDQTGDEASAHDTVYWGRLKPCDGSCIQERQLPSEVEALVRRFLETDGKERGELRNTTPRYSAEQIRHWESGE